MVSPQTIREITPSKLLRVSSSIYSLENMVFIVYSGLVPISPYTMPRAAMVSPDNALFVVGLVGAELVNLRPVHFYDAWHNKMFPDL